MRFARYDMWQSADREGKPFRGEAGGNLTFEVARVDCPRCLFLVREDERQRLREESGGG